MGCSLRPRTLTLLRLRTADMGAPCNPKTDGSAARHGGACELCSSGALCRWTGSHFNASTVHTSHSGPCEVSHLEPVLIHKTVYDGTLRAKLSRSAWPSDCGRSAYPD